MLNWKKVKLGNVADVKLSNVDKKTNDDERKVRLCNYTDVYRNPFINSEKARTFMVASCSQNEFETFRLKKGQVAITKDSETRDDIGVSTFIAEDFDDVVLGYHTSLIIPDERYLNGKFLHYWLNTKQAKTYFENNAGGSGQRCTLSLDIIKSFPLYLPDIATQEKIASFFYSLDSKVFLNNRINAELEAMAKTIYNYWFVQFDFPNNKDKPYKASGGTMLWSEDLKREVPEGWEVRELKDFADTGSGGTPTSTVKSYYENGTIPWINSGEVNQPYIVRAEKFITEEGLRNSSAKLFSRGTILMAMYGATAGKVSLMDVEACTNQAICAIIPHDTRLKYYIKCCLEDFYQYLVNLSSGSARDNLSQDKIRSLKMAVPSADVIEKFYQITQPSLEKILINLNENQKLAELRDWLLPMLMNGQVQIKDEQAKVVYKPAPLTNVRPAKPYFYQTQLVAAIINASKRNKIKHGEMTLAKYTYLLDKIYGVPTYFKFDRWHLGPYPKEMKKVVNNKKFFKIQNNEVAVVPQKKEYNYQFQQQVENAITDLASIFKEYSGKERSRQTELIATVCKVVEDIQSTDLKAVRESMKKWPIKLDDNKFKNKAEKFSEEETNAALKFIIKKGWVDALLIKDNR